MMRAPKQYGLLLELHPQLSILENRRNNELSLCIAILDRHVTWPAAVLAIGKQVFTILPFAFRNQAVRTVEYGLRRAVILFERDDLRRWHVLIRKTEDVFNLCGAERIDRLRIVTNNRNADPVGFQRIQNLRLNEIRILILIDKYVVEPRADFFCEFSLGDKVSPVQEQVVVIEHLATLLALHVMPEQFAEFVNPVNTPRVGLLQSLWQRLLRIHTARIDAKASIFFREPARGSSEIQFMTHDVHYVRCIAAIKHRKSRVQSKVLCIATQQPISNRMKRARPWQATCGQRQ